MRKQPGAVLLCLFAIGVLCATRLGAQVLPAVKPTVPPVTAPPAPVAPSHARIQYLSGKLSVEASDASLNEILNEISRKTGITITGGVRDERVFGNYGPADTASVLDQLLAGTESNMLLLASATDRSQQLILTPRNGGPTPPSPSSATYSRQDEVEPFVRHGRNLLPGAQASQPFGREPVPQAPPANAPAEPPAETTGQASPNGVKTPQQIYEELLQLQQKNATPGAAPK